MKQKPLRAAVTLYCDIEDPALLIQAARFQFRVTDRQHADDAEKLIGNENYIRALRTLFGCLVLPPGCVFIDSHSVTLDD